MHRAATAALALVMLLAVARAAADSPGSPGRVGPSLSTTPNGRALQPAGRMTTVGDFPSGGALTPDGRFYWAVDSGHGHDDVQIVDVRSGAMVQVLPLPGAYGGIAFAPGGRTAFVSGEPIGTSHPAGPVRGEGGDAIHVFSVDPASGRAVEADPIQLPPTSGGTAQSHLGASDAPGGTTPGAQLGWPQGLAVSPDGRTLVVALNQADQVAIVDLPSGQIRLVPVGRYPFGVAISRDGQTAWVTNEYDGTVSAVYLQSGTVIGSVSVGGANAHPEGILSDPFHDRMYVAVTNRDQVVQIDTRARALSKITSVAQGGGAGAQPVALALAPDGRTLYSADAGEDAIAAIAVKNRPRPRSKRFVRVKSVSSIDAYRKKSRRGGDLAKLQRRYLRGGVAKGCSGPSRADEKRYVNAVLRALTRHAAARKRAHGRDAKQRADARLVRDLASARARLPALKPCRHVVNGSLIGRIPTAAYPTGVSVSRDGKQLVWLAAKGLGAGPNPDYGEHFAQSEQAPYGTYVVDKLLGRVGVLARPSDRQLHALSARAAAQLRPGNLVRPPAGTPVVGANGGPSDRIRYVFYVVRENRTYDQIFGSEPRGDGSSALELFDDNSAPGPAGGVAPNAHALARQFPLLDHVYADSEVSVDGHMIASGGFATDYVQRALHANYSDRGRADEFGDWPITFPPNHFLFDQAARQGLPFRNYGELAAGAKGSANDGRATYPLVQGNTLYSYPKLFGCSGAQPPPDGTNNAQVCNHDSGTLGPGGTDTSHSRIDFFQDQFNQQVATGQVPRFNYITLPGDHTNGVRTNYPTPRAMAADNDLALGQLVDLISHSVIWPYSAIFVVEDDSQDGADHVDAHRMPAFAISPWARHGAVVHTRYDQESALRTMELILGLRPLSLFDAAAAPMYDAFVSGPGAQPDVTPYTAIHPQQALDEVNQAPATEAAGKLAASLPYDRLDLVPQSLFDRVLYRSVYGAGSSPPSPGPNASLLEAERAAGALRAFRNGESVRGWLLRTSPGDPDG